MAACIKEMPYYDYLLGNELYFSTLADYFIRHSMSNDGVLLGAYINEAPVGIAVMEFDPWPVLTYLFVEKQFREKGIGIQLIKAALTLAKERGAAEITACVITENEYGKVVDNMMQKTGFEVADTSTIIRYANDERCRRTWDLFMEKRGGRICNTLVRRGFKTVPFCEVPSEILNELKYSIGREFPSNLDPFLYISDPNDRLVPEYSFVTLKGDKPVAFVTVTTADDKTIVFQQLSVAFRHQERGIFILPFAAFMERFLTGSYSKVSAVVLDRNERMIRLVQGLIGALAESLKTQVIYKLTLA